jgi:hypothetical protein
VNCGCYVGAMQVIWVVAGDGEGQFPTSQSGTLWAPPCCCRCHKKKDVKLCKLSQRVS